MKTRLKIYISALLILSLLITGSGTVTYALETDRLNDNTANELTGIMDTLGVSENVSTPEDMMVPEDITAAVDEEASESYIPEEYLTYQDIDLEVEASQVAGETMRRGSLPSSYRTDASKLPPIKNQNPFGACWSFSAIASCEGSLVSNGYASASDIDLSERALCYFLYDLEGVDDPLNNTLEDYNDPDCSALGKSDIYQLGGNVQLAIFFLSNWGMPISEESAPYQGLLDIGSGGNLTKSNSLRGDDALDTALCYDPAFHMTQARIIDISDREGIKRAVMNNGIVSVSYQHRNESTYYNSDTAAYYTGSLYSGKTNHAVNIVGWDDGFPTDNFNRTSNAGIPENPGAWLIRNSYGTGRFDNGYMWISYEDKSLSNVVSVSCESRSDYDNNYFYDGATGTYGTEGVPQTAWRAANIFTASGNEVLRAVSIAFKSTDVEYSVQVYKGLKDPADPTSGTPALSVPVSGRSDYAGIYTVELGEDVPLEKDEMFSVVFTVEGGKNLFIEKKGGASSGGKLWISYNARIDHGQSFYSESLSDNTVSDNTVSMNTTSGNNVWMDMADQGSGMCFRIHAYTNDPSDTEKFPENVEPIQVMTYQSDRVGDYASQLSEALEKSEPGAGNKWRFENPDQRLTADDSAPTISVNVVSNKIGCSSRGCVTMRVTDIEFSALTEVPQLLYTDTDDIPLSGNAAYVGYDPGDELGIVYSSSNEDAVCIVSSNTVSGNNASYRLKVVGEGESEITAGVVVNGTAAAGLSTLSKKVEVNRSSIKIDKTMLRFNSAVSGSYDELYITSGYSHRTESVSLEGVSGFETEFKPGEDGRSGALTVYYNGVKMSRTLSARLKICLKNIEDPIYLNIRLNVKDIKPSLNVSTLSKVDHLYSGSYGAGLIRVTAGDGRIERVKLFNNDKNGKTEGVFNPTAYSCGDIVSMSGDGRTAYVSVESNGENPAWNKGCLKVWIEGYGEPVIKDISVGYTTGSLKADTLKATVLTSGQEILPGNSIAFRINNRSDKTVEEFEDPDIVITNSSGRALDQRYSAQYADGVFTIIPGEVTLPDKGEELYISITDSIHASAFRLDRFRVIGQDISKTSLILTNPTVTMYYYDDDKYTAINDGIRSSSVIKVKNCSGAVKTLMEKITDPKGADVKSRQLIRKGFIDISLNKETGEVAVSYPSGKHPEAGTYKYTFKVSREDVPGLKKDITTSLTVKVKKLDPDLAGTAKVSLKGRLDVLNREGSFVEVIPKFNNLPDTYAVRLMELQGKDMDKFTVTEDKSDPSRYYIGLAKGAKLDTRQKYEVGMVYTVYTGGGIMKITVPPVKIQVTQGKIRLSADESLYFSNGGISDEQQLTIYAYNNAGSRIDISKLELENPGRGFKLNDNGDGSCVIEYAPDGSIKDGGSYTLKIRVSPADGASDKKPSLLSCKVNVTH